MFAPSSLSITEVVLVRYSRSAALTIEKWAVKTVFVVGLVAGTVVEETTSAKVMVRIDI